MGAVRARCAPGTLWPRAPERAGLGQPTQACEQIFALWASTAHKRRRPGIPIEGSRARQTPRRRHSLKGVVTEAAARVSVFFFLVPAAVAAARNHARLQLQGLLERVWNHPVSRHPRH